MFRIIPEIYREYFLIDNTQNLQKEFMILKTNICLKLFFIVLFSKSFWS